MLMKDLWNTRRYSMQFLVNAFPVPTQVKVVRRRVLQHDLDMYAAISGKSPGMPSAPPAGEEPIKVPAAARARPWSPAVLATYLTGLGVPRRLGIRAVKPEVADWVRRLSNHALERLQEAQGRLTTSRPTARADRRGDPIQAEGTTFSPGEPGGVGK
jgi:hypothetical protein